MTFVAVQNKLNRPGDWLTPMNTLNLTIKHVYSKIYSIPGCKQLGFPLERKAKHKYPNNFEKCLIIMLYNFLLNPILKENLGLL